MTDNYLLFGRKVIPVGTAASFAASYTRLSDASAYTPQKGDTLIIFANATKAVTGNATLTTPSGWSLAGQSPANNNSASINQSSFVLTRSADGTATDSPTVTVSNASSVIWQVVTYVIKGAVVNSVPSSPTALPQTGSGPGTTAANTGVALTTVKSDEVMMSFLGVRAPVSISALAWSGTTADLPFTQSGSTNNFVATAISRKAQPGSITPSATWTGGSGTVSTIITIGLAMRGDAVGVQS